MYTEWSGLWLIVFNIWKTKVSSWDCNDIVKTNAFFIIKANSVEEVKVFSNLNFFCWNLSDILILECDFNSVVNIKPKSWI